MTDLRLIGYWRVNGDPNSAYPHPGAWIDLAWDSRERHIVGGYLSAGTVLRAYMGFSPCRICGRNNGAAEYTDGTYVWPEGLSHYVDEHSVRLPPEFVDHVVRRSDALEAQEVSDSWWRNQPARTEATVTALSSADPEPTMPAAPAGMIEHRDGGDGLYLDATSVWSYMVTRLAAADGHRVLAATARGTIANGHAEVSWTEVHQMTDAAYRELVAQSRQDAERDRATFRESP
ncbi:hypothetical protein Back2_20040 [Nocardioides baekrokdamisoli]|uniref:Uncharacterized protein n=1 Tax=Nocardioides baekrokdamisoli TaxID=1804624 RepID=A0A3G9IFI9_9ACTN|nr:hypothetical protein [Nocardioides baekrokdamisoli]BBH17717.1 hypothetical protein Back2_20040 [Nocardioides baekrokdamisoli]